jgi:chemotaxis protein methyltransferase CheR
VQAAADDVWQTVRTFMRQTCGVTLADDQSYLLEGRVAPLLAGHGFATTRELVAAACKPGRLSALAMTVIDAMTTHETFFFRDLPFWRTLEEVVIPDLLRRGRRRLRFWSSGCAHGQEPYSIAMLLEERWPELAPLATIQATDVSALAIGRAREGFYTVLEVNRGLGAARLLRHFDRSPRGGYVVKTSLRARITWEAGNLLSPAPVTYPFDVILCRNVLIYFAERERSAVLTQLASATNHAGYVGLGVSELGKGRSVAPGWWRTD